MPRQPPAYVQIAERYAQRIRSGNLQPGQQLPSYAVMATDEGVSDIVIRQAIRLLGTQGLVRSEPRRGTFVADQPSQALDAIADAIRQLTYARQTLEILKRSEEAVQEVLKAAQEIGPSVPVALLDVLREATIAGYLAAVEDATSRKLNLRT